MLLRFGREAALVADAGAEAAGAQHLLERVVGLDPGAERLGEGLEPERHEHELLDVDVVVGVGAAVQDVELGHRQDGRGRAAQVGVERQAGGAGRRLGDRERGAQDGVGPQPLLRGGAVQVDQVAVDQRLVPGVHAAERPGDLPLDVLDRLGHPLAAVALAAVAQLQGLAAAGRGAGRHRRAPPRPSFQKAFDLEGRVTAGIENLSGVDLVDREHRCSCGGSRLVRSVMGRRAGDAGALRHRLYGVSRPAVRIVGMSPPGALL